MPPSSSATKRTVTVLGKHRMPSLTQMQKRYVWLAGAFPALVVVQGRGYRQLRTMYNVDPDAGELTIFGYGDPLYFLVGRGLFRKLQMPGTYTLTDEGEEQFKKMLIRGDGGRLNDEVREVRKAATVR